MADIRAFFALVCACVCGGGCILCSITIVSLYSTMICPSWHEMNEMTWKNWHRWANICEPPQGYGFGCWEAMVRRRRWGDWPCAAMWGSVLMNPSIQKVRTKFIKKILAQMDRWASTITCSCKMSIKYMQHKLNVVLKRQIYKLTKGGETFNFFTYSRGVTRDTDHLTYIVCFLQTISIG